MSEARIHPASFRDPSGFVFFADGDLLRQVDASYGAHYDRLMEGGLYQALVDRGLLVAHREEPLARAARAGAYKVLRPEPLPFISYPYEWCFGQLRAAALATLEIQRCALEHDMSLKDASAYNLQFRGPKPALIDTLSFETYEEGRPWIAYRQFCQHFLAPLALMAYRDVRLAGLLRTHLDGIPLDLASALLPWRTRLRFSLFTHLHLHARYQQRYAKAGEQGASRVRERPVSRRGLIGILDSLTSAVRGLVWSPPASEWGDYYDDTNYSDAALEHKRERIAAQLDEIRPNLVSDLGANTGGFSREASRRGIDTIAFDVDPVAVERNHARALEQDDARLLPLWLDLTNPSPALGWAHRERASLAQRGPADCVLALALVHHLAISNNVPLERVAAHLAELGRWLVVEFVPKQDSQVQRLLATREDVFPHYHEEGFEAAFRACFEIEAREPIEGTQRILYRMRRRLRED